MAEIRECPNPECRSEHILIEADIDDGYQASCACGMRGPMRATEDLAWESWDALPREEPWRKVEDGLPFETKSHDVDRVRVDVHMASGLMLDTAWFCWDTGEHYPHEWEPKWAAFDGYSLEADGDTVTHWRPHTPPRGPGG